MTVKELLSSGTNESFVIPPYQRPYSWNTDNVCELFNNLWDFSQGEGGCEKKNKASYFLGCIVLYNGVEDRQEIVDGQQRIITLSLLLRALYTRLGVIVPNDNGLSARMNDIAPTLWELSSRDNAINFSKPLVVSQAMDDKYNDIFQRILETGHADETARDKYSCNYIKIQELIEEKINECGLQQAVIKMNDFCYAILNQALIFPILASNEEMAQTVFHTLNSLGMPLQDADIFKAQIYKHIEGKEEKNRFVEHWKRLSEQASELKLDIQSLLTYYMFYLKAKRKNANSSLQSLRKFYAGEGNNYKDLYEKDLLDRLEEILLFLRVVIRREKIDGEEWSQNTDILKMLDILRFYPNEYWKYPTIIYYMTYKNTADFIPFFRSFLRQLAGELVKKFCVSSTINSIKSKVLNLNIDIFQSPHPHLDFETPFDDVLNTKISQPSQSIRQMLLAILAYTKQDELLVPYWEIEHIFPTSWTRDFEEQFQSTKEYINHLGNYLPLEKSLNIKASDHYFLQKKPEYLKSTIAIAEDMGRSTKSSFLRDDIVRRDQIVENDICNCLKSWGQQYEEAWHCHC